MNVLRKRKRRETLSKMPGEDEGYEQKKKAGAFKYTQEVNIEMNMEEKVYRERTGRVE